MERGVGGVRQQRLAGERDEKERRENKERDK